MLKKQAGTIYISNIQEQVQANFDVRVSQWEKSYFSGFL